MIYSTLYYGIITYIRVIILQGHYSNHIWTFYPEQKITQRLINYLNFFQLWPITKMIRL